MPDERVPVLAALWRVLKPGGILFINQTPNRWFPIEQHTTGLPLLNYLPARLALRVARMSPRCGEGDTWNVLLRKGIRGGSERGIVRELARSGLADFTVLRPERLGARDAIDVWYQTSSPRGRPLKAVLRMAFKVVAAIGRIDLVPAFLVMALTKNPGRGERLRVREEGGANH